MNCHTIQEATPLLQKIKEAKGEPSFPVTKDGVSQIPFIFDGFGAGVRGIGVRYNDKEAKVVKIFEEEDIMAQLKEVRGWYESGIINADAPQMAEGPTYKACFIAQGWSLAAKTVWGPNMGKELVAYTYGPTILSNDSVLGSVNFVSVNTEHPDKALAYLNLINTDSKVRDAFYYGLEGDNFTYTEDEIRCIVEESHRSGRLNALENTLIKNSFDFFDLMARDVMIPRNEIVVFHFDEDLSEAMRRVLPKSHHTCYPVCIEDRDQIIGFIHVKDLLQGCLSGQLSLKKINREILTVPEVMPAPALLQLMKNRRIYLAVVVDEYGGTSGLVTLNDLVEELIGEIPQPAENVPYEIVRQKDGTYEFDGTVILEDVSDRLEINLAGENKSATIAGFVFSNLERIPKVGDYVDFSGWRFTVLRLSGFRIVRVKAEKVTGN